MYYVLLEFTGPSNHPWPGPVRSWRELRAETYEAAEKETSDIVGVHQAGLKSATILRVVVSTIFNLRNWRDEQADKLREQEMVVAKEKRRQQYEALKVEFEGGINA